MPIKFPRKWVSKHSCVTNIDGVMSKNVFLVLIQFYKKFTLFSETFLKLFFFREIVTKPKVKALSKLGKVRKWFNTTNFTIWIPIRPFWIKNTNEEIDSQNNKATWHLGLWSLKNSLKMYCSLFSVPLSFPGKLLRLHFGENIEKVTIWSSFAIII